LYPDLYDGEHYGGTRYMPLPFTLQAGLARLTGNYLVAGKILAYGTTVVVCVLLWIILRRVRCSPGVAIALLSLLLTSHSGYLACTTIRGDLLPIALQLAALVVGTWALTPRCAAAAAGFCTLAVLAKVTAGWAPLALAWFYYRSNRGTFGVFLGIWLGSLI